MTEKNDWPFPAGKGKSAMQRAAELLNAPVRLSGPNAPRVQVGQLLGAADLKRIREAHDRVVLYMRSAGGRTSKGALNAMRAWDELMRELLNKADPGPGSYSG